ncbi:hypothetical protein F5880DRAFT_546747 [Lentinula raphanica]|nr:hypothetical protein F5880DRAFT_546747 [Lentinula raphanica]
MRSRIIYAFYVAVTLLATASIDASPLPAGTSKQPPQKKARVESKTRLYVGLLDAEGNWVPLTADAKKRNSARSSMCFGTVFKCLVLRHSDSQLAERLDFIDPQILEPTTSSGPTPLVPQASPRSLDLDYYQTLPMSIRSLKSLQPFENDPLVPDSLKDAKTFREWLSKNSKDSESLNVDDYLILYGMYCFEQLSTELRDKTAKLVCSLKADSGDEEYQGIWAKWALRKKDRDRKAQKKLYPAVQNPTDANVAATANSVVASPLHVKSTALYVGLLDDGEDWVPLNADAQKRKSARTLLCFGTVFKCLVLRYSDSQSAERLEVINPQLSQPTQSSASGPTPLVPRASPRTSLNLDYYQTLPMSIRHLQSRRPFENNPFVPEPLKDVQQFRKWLLEYYEDSEYLTVDEYFILYAMHCFDSEQFSQEMRDKTVHLLHSLKANSGDKAYRDIWYQWGFRKRERDRMIAKEA